MGQEYSTIDQIIMKADRGKAIAWRSVSKMTCHHSPDLKNSQSAQFIFSYSYLHNTQSITKYLYVS